MIPRMDNPINGYLLRDKHGQLLPGGRLEFFDDQTDLPENVYDAGSDQTVSLGYVVYADAYGLLPDFELTPNKDYRLRCYDSEGSFQWDRGGVANNISNLEARVEALEKSVAALGEQSGPRNLLTNGACKATRAWSQGVTFPVREEWSLGELAGIYARVPSVTEGSFRRAFDSGFGSVGVFAQLNDVTTTNSESVAELMWRMPAGDGAAISGNDLVFQIKASQNSGSSMNAYVTLYKCLIRDDFSNLVTITASAPVSLASGIVTQLSLPIEGPGDLSTGVAVVVTFDCGIVSNTHFVAGEAQLETGLVSTQFEDRPQLIDQGGWYERDLEGVGGVLAMPVTQNPPGRIICDGAELLRADYPRLWWWAQEYSRVVDETTWQDNNRGAFSSGNGTTTFRAPDLITNNPFIRLIGPSGARAVGSYQDDAFQGHNFEFKYNNTPVTDDTPGIGAGIHHLDTSKTATDRVMTPISDGANGAPRVADETRPKNYGLVPCMKY